MSDPKTPITPEEKKQLAQWEKEHTKVELTRDAKLAFFDTKKDMIWTDNAFKYEKEHHVKGRYGSEADFQPEEKVLSEAVQKYEAEIAPKLKKINQDYKAASAAIDKSSNMKAINHTLKVELTALLPDLNNVKGLPERVAKDHKKITVEDVKHALSDHGISLYQLDKNLDGDLSKPEILEYAQKEVKLPHAAHNIPAKPSKTR